MSKMRQAMQTAGIAKYKPTRHAIDRAKLRFGIAADKAVEWINGLMRNARRIGESGAKGVVYQSGDVRLVIDESSGLVITLHPELKADFLRPMLEREKRKLHRLYTPRIRQHELKYAESLQELADMALNRAKARNPNTRDLIAERMSDKLADAERVMRTIERLNDEWRAKVRAIEVISE